MKKLLFILAFVATILFITSFSVQGKPDEFTIVNADATNTLAYVPSSELTTLISNIPERFVIIYANVVRGYKIIPVPDELKTLFSQVQDRFIFQYANASKDFKLGYPTELINDKNPPQVSNLAVSQYGINGVRITWTTNEFTTCLLEYGLQSGVYTGTLNDNEYRKYHEFKITGLNPGNNYYFRFKNTDISNNMSQNSEISFFVERISYIYLPLLVK